MKLYITFLLFFTSINGLAVEFVDIPSSNQKKIIKRFPGLNQSPVSFQTIDRALKYISRLKDFESAKASYVNDQLQIIGLPVKYIHKVVVKGNKSISKSKILDQILLKPGRSYDQQTLNKSLEKIQNLYKASGYFDVRLATNYSAFENHRNKINLTIQITENKPNKIKKIIFLSKNKELNEKLQKLTKSYTSEKYSALNLEKLQKKINTYLKNKQYYLSKIENVSPTPTAGNDQSEAQFKITVPYKYEFHYLGNQKITLSALNSEVQRIFKENWTTDPVDKIKPSLLKIYGEKGYSNAKIDVEVFRSKTGFTRKVKINIVEKKKTVIKALTVGGKYSLDKKFYSKYILQNSPSPVDSSIFYQPSLEKGIENLILELKNRGFLHAQYISTRIENIKPHLIKVKVVINEGPKTNIQSVQFKGNKTFTSEDLTSIVKIKEKDFLDLNKFEESLQKISNYYFSQGFLEMKFVKDSKYIKYSKNNSQSDITYNINEGPQIVIEDILIKGNDFTKKHVILKEIKIKKGDILTAQKLIDAQTKLAKLGFFRSVDIRTSDQNSDISQRKLIVTVNERNPGVFKLGVGASNESQFNIRGYTGASYNNLYGTARAIYTRFDLQYDPKSESSSLSRIWRLSGGYVEPYLLNTLNRGRIKTELERDITGLGTDQKSTLNRRISFLVESDLSRHLKMVWTAWSLDSQSQTLVSSGLQEKIDVTQFGPRLNWDTRDNPFLPTKGLYSFLDLQYSTPLLGSSRRAHFYKSEANLTTYFKLLRPDFILATSFRGGYARKVGNQTDGGIPEDYLFILGGFSTIRGFGGSSQIERVPSSIDFPRTDQVVTTEYSHFGLVKTELRFPIYEDFGGVVFWDAATVRIQGFEFAQRLRQSYGFGFRLNTPVGPLVVDFAFKAKQVYDKEDTKRVHVSVGTF